MNFRQKRITVGLLLLIITPLSLLAEAQVARIVYLDGAVQLYRDDRVFSLTMKDIGSSVENYDLIKTGKDGQVTMEMTTTQRQGTEIHVQPRTSFHIDVQGLTEQKKSNFKVLQGSLRFRVGKLTGNEGLNVRTESAVMGVRGTSFTVIIAPDASVLVTCETGRVACSDENNIERIAEPGSVVEKTPQQNLRAIAIDPEDISLYESYWTGVRDNVFSSNAGYFIKKYALRYNDTLPDFLDAYRELIRYSERLEDAAEQQQEGTLTTADQLMIKKDVSPAVFGMRSIFEYFEHTVFRLIDLEHYHAQDIGSGMIEDSLSSAAFFRQFKGELEDLLTKMGVVRYIFRQFVVFSGGIFPEDDMMGEVFGGGNAFEGSGMPESSMPESKFP